MRACYRESLLEAVANLASVQLRSLSYPLPRFINIVDEEPGDALIDNFGHRPACKGDHRRAACHGLDHDQSKGLRPVDRKKQGTCVAQEITLVGIVDLADEFHEWIPKQRSDLMLEVLALRIIDFRCHPDAQVRAAR